MAELSKIRKNGVDYDIKDAVARKAIEDLEIPESGVTDEQIASAVEEYMAEHSVSGGGLTAEQITALDNMFKVCAFTKADVSAEYNAFCTAFGIEGGIVPDEPDIPDEPTVNLSSISVTYSGGDVAVGTAVNNLTGIVVTAHYSDGTSKAVTGYTLSGTIGEGSNTITVSYGGKTATFTVTGVAESGGGEEADVSNETTWTSGVAYTFEPIADSYPDNATGEIKAYDGWYRSPYLYCAGASTLRGIVRVKSTAFGGTKDNAFYDADKNYIAPIGAFRFDALAGQEAGAYHDIQIPENAAYFIVSAGSTLYSNGCIEYIPYE